MSDKSEPLLFPPLCRYYLKSYVFVSQLEALNIPHTVRSFLSSPKEGLVKGLWKNHSHEPQVPAHMKSSLHCWLNAGLGAGCVGMEVNGSTDAPPPLLSCQAVRLVADLCLEYQVYDPQLWNGLLQKLLGFNQVRIWQSRLECDSAKS